MVESLMNRFLTSLIFLLILLLSNKVSGAERPTSDTLSGATRVWDEFVNALRTGDMPEAYARLSRDSREELSYRDFCVEWHPVGIKYNTILSNPGYSDFIVYGNIATVKIGLDPSLNNSQNYFIRIIIEKDTDNWYIVDEKVQQNAICRASVTGVLQDVLQQSKTLNAAFKTGRGSFEDIIKELPRIFSSERGKLALRNYTFELDLLRNGYLRATPRNKQSQTGYQITQDGRITSFSPSKQELITAEALEHKRERLKQQRLRTEKQQYFKSPVPSAQKRDENTRKIKTIQAVNITTSTASNLPDLPPDFPMDFNRVKENTPPQAQPRRLKFLESEENFDLPEIDNVKKIIGSRDHTKAHTNNPATTDNITINDTRTMVGASSEIHANDVELSSEDMLKELELMVEEYDANADLTIAGDNNNE